MGLALFLACLVLAAVFGYFGFVRPDPRWHGVNSRNRLGAVMLALLSLVALYSVWADYTAPDRLAEYLPPYPGARATHVPGTGDGSLWWLLYTEDSPEAVLEFYRQEANRPGWAVHTDEAPLIVLRRGDLEVAISAIHSRGETSISYRLGAH